MSSLREDAIKKLAESMGLTYYDPVEDDISPFAGMYVGDNGKTGYPVETLGMYVDAILALVQERIPKKRTETRTRNGELISVPEHNGYSYGWNKAISEMEKTLLGEE